MNVFRFWLNRRNSKGAYIFNDVACDFPSIDALHAALAAGQPIIGDQLWAYNSRDDEGPCMAIKRTTRVILGAAMIASVEVPPTRFVKFTDEAPGA